MYREQLNISFDVFGHVGVEAAEILKVIADPCFLLRVLLQDPLRNDISSILFLDDHLLKALVHMVERFRKEAEAWIIKYLFLDAAHDSEFGLGAAFAELS